jgi:protein-tyrosine phosphatase
MTLPQRNPGFSAPLPNCSRLLFVCMGNICRSPLAEGVFAHLAHERGVRDQFTIDSCGTGGWHAGELPDPRARATAARYGIHLTHRARQFEPADLQRFDLLLAMDRANLRALQAAGASPARARLLREFDPSIPGALLAGDPPEVPDPYYGSGDGFEQVYAMLRGACAGLLDALLADITRLQPERRSRQASDGGSGSAP